MQCERGLMLVPFQLEGGIADGWLILGSTNSPLKYLSSAMDRWILLKFDTGSSFAYGSRDAM